MDNIALTITLNGIQQTITSIQELERVIFEAKEQLQKFQGTQQEFNALNSQVNKLETALTKIKSSKTQELINSFAQIGSTVTASFATAQAALNLFGVQSENVTKAAAQAQNLLTFALGAREIAQNLTTLSQARLTIATWAGQKATVATTLATRIFFTVLKANPIGIIITLFAALAGAMFLYNKNTEEAAAKTEALKRAQEDLQTQSDRQIALLQAAGASELEIQNARIKGARDQYFATKAILDNTSKDDKEYYDKKRDFEAAASKLQEEKTRKNTLLRNEDKKAHEEELQRLDKLKAKAQEVEAARQKALEETAAKLTELNKALNVEIGTDFPESEQLKNLREYNKLLEDYARILTDPEFIKSESFLLGQQAVKNISDGLQKEGDVLFGLVERYRMDLKNAVSGYGDDITKVTGEFLDKAGMLVQEGLITPEAFEAIRDYTNAYEVLAQKGIDIPQYLSKATQNEFLNLTRAIKINSGTLTRELDENGKVVAASTNLTFTQATLNLEKFLKDNEDSFTQYLIATDKEIQQITDPVKQEAEARKRAQARIDIITKQTNEILDQEERILIYIEERDKLLLEKQVNTNKAIFGAVASNIDKLIERYADLYDFDTQEAEIAFDEKIRSLVDFNKLTDEELKQLAALYQMFYEKLNEYRTQNENKEETAFQKRLKSIKEGLEAFQTALQAVGQTVQEFNQFALDQLDKRYQRSMERIVGDTKEAADKRIEVEKAYLAEKARLEKRAAKSTLQISRAQALANTAVAITKALEAGPIVGTIAAGIVAAASAAQVILITQQINAIDSYRKGGLIKKQSGGFIVKGPAHEYGGVKYQGGGIELEGNEAVINRVSTVRYGELLNQINMAGGGTALVNNFDDSRIVEAIAKQRMEPIRAYVVESDITNKQQVARRLELLSQI